ncbi:MAG TPA: type VI secretion system protein IglI family protein [Kofleriaceae bacterium]|nr:type VI secretion system protein IglI family protein [Kofleriaceae bacterium]
MTESTALRADLLDGGLAPSSDTEDAATASRIAHVAQLADRGDHHAAAREAAELIEARVHDVRLAGFYLLGVFLDRGIAYLPALLGRAAALVGNDLALLRPSRNKLATVGGATARLFETISARLQFHTRQRDATWDAWRAAGDDALVDAIAAGCSRLTLALEAVIDAPRAAVPLARIRRWASDDLRRAIARPDRVAHANSAAGAGLPIAAGAAAGESATGEPPGDVIVDDESYEFSTDDGIAGGDSDDTYDDARDDSLDDWPDDSHDRAERLVSPHAARGRHPPSAPHDIAAGSPALTELQAKLRGFQDLIERRELAKAAVVVRDVRHVLADFDPVAFFPAMFAAYFKTLHEVVHELAPYFANADDPAWHALESYYRADMRAFFAVRPRR